MKDYGEAPLPLDPEPPAEQPRPKRSVNDLVASATASWVRSGGDWPSTSSLRNAGGRWYVILGSVMAPHAVYRVRGNDRLVRMRWWPAIVAGRPCVDAPAPRTERAAARRAARRGDP